MHALLLCTQHLCTLLKFGDQSDYMTTFTRLLEIGCVSFCFFMDQETAFCNSIANIVQKSPIF